MAQSTGTVEFEEEAIVVTGSRAPSVGGVEVPDTSKTREVLNAEFIQRQTRASRSTRRSTTCPA